jgi:hypothetical protein
MIYINVFLGLRIFLAHATFGYLHFTVQKNALAGVSG